jgi:twinkle protein
MDMTASDSLYLYKTSCPACGSSDANAVYTDSHTFCFACSKRGQLEGALPPQSEYSYLNTKKSSVGLMSPGEYKALPSRGLSEETCRKFGYSVNSERGLQIAAYYKDGSLCAQHTRDKMKDFSWIGDSKGVELFGQHLWGEGGKKVVILEGEIDAMSLSQLQSHKWPCVSIPSGVNGAAKSLKANLKWLESFEEVILMFDNDEPGSQAAEAVAKALQECASLFTPGKCKIARLPLKDANEMLVAGRGAEVIQAIWNAKEWRPDGLISVDELLEEIEKPAEWGIPWFLESLTKATYGRRYGEIYGFGAGTGIGKTDWLTQQIAYDVDTLGLPVGLMFLETPVAELGKRVAGKIAGRTFHIPDSGWEKSELTEAVQKLRGKVTFYNNFGQTDWQVIKGHIRFMAVAQGIKIFYLDHLTALADTADEKGSLEQIMKEMAGLANELKIIIHFVSHLATPEKGSHEEGARVKIREFKGSRSIGMWAFFLFGLERNQQDEDPVRRQITTFRILKDRNTGASTGMAFYLRYDRETGRLYETTAPDDGPGFKDHTKKSPLDGNEDF